MERLLLNRRFPAKTAQLKQMRDWVRETVVQNGLTNEKVDKVIIGVNEACMNIIEHAYRSDQGEIILDIFEENNTLIFILTDFAPTIDCSAIKSRELEDIRPGGLGVHFIKEVMDEVEYLPGNGGLGNAIKMKIRINT